MPTLPTNLRRTPAALPILAVAVLLLTACSSAPFAQRGSPVVAALNENDIEAVAVCNPGMIHRVRGLRPEIGTSGGDWMIITDRAYIRRFLDSSLYVPDSPNNGTRDLTGHEIFVITFLPKPGATPKGKRWATEEDLFASQGQFDNHVSVNIFHSRAFAALLDEIAGRKGNDRRGKEKIRGA